MECDKNFFELVCDMSRDELIDVIMLLAGFITMPSEKLEDLLKDVDLTESTMIVAKEITD
jgi:hypothetical protein